MINLTAQIDLIGGNNNLTISQDDIDYYDLSEISAPLSAVLNTRVTPKNVFLLGSSRFSDMAVLTEGKVDYFVGAYNSYETVLGITVPLLRFHVAGIKSGTLTIAFDTINNRHPKSIMINGVRYYDDDAVFTATNIEGDVATVSIGDWNTLDSPVIITGIYESITLNINKRNMISMGRKIQERANYNLPSYGIMSNSAEIVFRDTDGEVKDYAENLLLTSDLSVRMYLNDTLSGTFQQIGKFETREWDYDDDNRTVSVTLKDDLEEWQEIYIDSIPYDARQRGKVYSTLADLYKWLHGKTPEKYDMSTFEELDAATQAILSNYVVEYPILNKGTLWQGWHKLCEVSGCYIYKDSNGITKFKYRYGA
jgi:hypothetical protein